MMAIEDCFKLTLADMGKGLLAKEKVGEFELLIVRSNTILHGSYTTDLSDDTPTMFLNCAYNGRKFQQEINLESDDIRYGVRPYLRCGCGHRGNVLYLRPSRHYFACQRCLNLYYELTAINRSAGFGELQYRLNRLLKIDDAKHRMKRPYYHGRLTRAMYRIAKMYNKWVLDPGAVTAIEAQFKALVGS